jgi:flagellar biosynthesis protein FlhF
MVEEQFSAPTPLAAFELAREKYGVFSNLKLLRATQRRDENGKLWANIVVAVPQEDYLASIGIDEEEELVNEINQLRSQMSKLKSAVDLDSHDVAIDEVREMMLKKGISREWLSRILDPVESDSLAQDKSLLLSYVLEGMDEQLEVLPETRNRRVLMLVGPTGVGKTTTIAKLASRYSLDRKNPKSVALINLDTFRVGAYEQMEHYASILGIRHIKVDTIERFKNALDEVSDQDVVLIDTAGISPYDIGRLIKTVEFLKSLPSHSIETALVISATAKYDDIVAIYDHFSFMDLDSVILTKFDETRRIGEALGFVLEKELPVSYVSTGQNVPEDLIPADKEQIMIRFVEELHV